MGAPGEGLRGPPNSPLPCLPHIRTPSTPAHLALRVPEHAAGRHYRRCFVNAAAETRGTAACRAAGSLPGRASSRPVGGSACRRLLDRGAKKEKGTDVRGWGRRSLARPGDPQPCAALRSPMSRLTPPSLHRSLHHQAQQGQQEQGQADGDQDMEPLVSRIGQRAGAERSAREEGEVSKGA